MTVESGKSSILHSMESGVAKMIGWYILSELNNVTSLAILLSLHSSICDCLATVCFKFLHLFQLFLYDAIRLNLNQCNHDFFLIKPWRIRVRVMVIVLCVGVCVCMCVSYRASSYIPGLYVQSVAIYSFL